MIRYTNIRLITAGILLALPGQIASGQSGSYHIRHYDLLIDPDFGTRKISLSAMIVIENPGLEDTFEFGLNDNYDSVEVTSRASQVTTSRGDGSISVKTKKPAREDTLLFELKGTLGKSLDEDRAVVDDSSLFLLWSDRFYPIAFDQWATVKIRVILPAGFQAIAPGRESGTDNSGSMVEHVFETSRPTTCFSVFADSRWISTVREVNGIRMETLLYPESQNFSEQIFGTSGEVLDFYSRMFCAYPFDRFTFVTIRGMYARRAFPGFVGYEPQYLEKEFSTTGLDAHETALLWWGYTIRGNGPGSFQWTEGFGDYAEILFDEKYGKSTPTNLTYFREKYLETPAAGDLLYSELRGNTPQELIHGKYPWLMHLVRYVVGDSSFRKAMRLVFERFRYRTFSMNEFISVMEEGCGQSLGWFRKEWLERRGVPEVELRSRVRKIGSAYRLTCIIEQRGNLYHLPLEIGIQSSKGLRVEKVKLAGRKTTLETTLMEEPTRVLFDPKGWILMRRLQPGKAP